jgi:type IV pilus assembly protein PilN
MTRINLLPWRELQREQEKKLFTALLAFSVFISGLLVLLGYSYSSHLVNNQTDRNQMLQKEITSLNEQIKEIRALKKVREALISRMSIVQNLQSTRTMMVHLFDELIKIMPEGVYIYKVERKNDIITVSGYSDSNTKISILMRSIESNDWLQSPILTQIQSLDETRQSAPNEFTLSFLLKAKNQGS